MKSQLRLTYFRRRPKDEAFPSALKEGGCRMQHQRTLRFLILACVVAVGVGMAQLAAQAPPANRGLVSWWPGSNIGDVRGPNDGLLINGATIARGKIRGGFSFDGVDDYLMVPSNSSLDADQIVISQIYGEGGTTGATYRNDFLEIFNRGSNAVNLRNYIFQFASATGIFGFAVSVSGGIIQPGQHMLVQLGSSGPNGASLPTPDFNLAVTQPPPLGLSGKVAITKAFAPLISSTCVPLPDSNIVDLVGFGTTANCYEGTGPTTTLNNTTAAFRKDNGCTDTDNNASDFVTSAPSPRNGSSPFTSCEVTPTPSVQFSSQSFFASETETSVVMTVNRLGSTAAAATVDYGVSSNTSYVPCGNSTGGVAAQNCDYIIAAGTLNFAAGETSKSFTMLLVDDMYVEGNETVSLSLSSPIGSVLGTPSTATLTITDNDAGIPTTNPLDDARFFVRQQYSDFLNREPDQGGWDFWTEQITSCPPGDQLCVNARRVRVSNAFFFELEYQQTGAYVFRLYRAAYGNNQPFPNPDTDPQFPGERQKVPGYVVFVPDRARVVGGSNLAQSQLELADAFVQRAEFLTRYPASLDGPSFITAILNTIRNDSGADLTGQEGALLSLFNQGGRGAVLYRLADDNLETNPINNRAFIDAEYRRAFVTTQYFGYLRRDADMGGLLFWLGQVNRFPLRDTLVQNAMVCSFVTSSEYQQRLSQVVTHSNQECLQ